MVLIEYATGRGNARTDIIPHGIAMIEEVEIEDIMMMMMMMMTIIDVVMITTTDETMIIIRGLLSLGLLWLLHTTTAHEHLTAHEHPLVPHHLYLQPHRTHFLIQPYTFRYLANHRQHH